MKAFLSYLWMIEIQNKKILKYQTYYMVPELPIGVGKSTYIYDMNLIPRETIYSTDCFEEFYS